MTQERVRLFDTHCHMDAFAEDLHGAFNRAYDSGVDKFMIPACGVFNWDKVEAIAEHHKGVRFSLGIHPHFIKQYSTEQHGSSDLQLLDEKLSRRSDKCVAVGECGLDFYHSREKEGLQKYLFTSQVQLANQYRLPLILHCRKAHQEMVKILKAEQVSYGGVIHAFSGSIQQAMDYIELGFYIGVGGVITYPRAKKTRETISQLPLTALVLETDSPDMPLFGRQGERNHPENIKYILDALVMLRKEPAQIIARQIYKNSERLIALRQR